MKLVVKKSSFFITLIGILFNLIIGSLDMHDKCVFMVKKSGEETNFSSNNKFNKLNFFVDTEKDSNFCVEEFEFEIEFDYFKQILFENSDFDVVIFKNNTTSSCQFFSIKNKIPLYKLFCNWKLYPDLILV